MSTPPELQPCVAGCGRAARTRGLCALCYQRAGRAVRRGETTWPQLEAEGRARPPAPPGEAWRKGFKLQ